MSRNESRSTAAELVEGLRAKKRDALARAISWVENAHVGFEDILQSIHREVGKAYRVGITGPPGAGKSTLTEQLARIYVDRGESVAIVAVDPSSPVTGGALLGDRIRMAEAAEEKNVFIRSMATRGAVGGLSITTTEVCDVLDAFGFHKIIVETVGVGQSELAVTDTADAAILVVVPESGDSVQVLKAGVMEIADIFVVNKADRPGAGDMAKSIFEMLQIRIENATKTRQPSDWAPSVIETVALNGTGVQELVDAIDAHANAIKKDGQLERRRLERRRVHTKEIVERTVRRKLWDHASYSQIFEDKLEMVMAGEESPYEAARAVVKEFFPPSDIEDGRED